MSNQQSIFADGSDQTPDELSTAPLELYRQLALAAQQRLKMGQTPSREEIKAVRELALLESQDIAWPDRAAMTQDLDLTPKQVEKLIAAGLPAPGHSPIPKAPALLWYIAHLRDHGGQVSMISLDNDPQHQKAIEEVRWRRLKNDQLENRMAAEADAMVLTVLSQILRDLKQRLIFAAPVRIRAALDEAEPHLHERCIREQIARILTEAASESGSLDEDDDQPPPIPTTPDGQE